MQNQYEHSRIKQIEVKGNIFFELLDLPDYLNSKILRVFTEAAFTQKEADYICKMLNKTVKIKKEDHALNGYILITVSTENNTVTPNWYCVECINHYLSEENIHPENAEDNEILIAILKKHKQFNQGGVEHVH